MITTNYMKNMKLSQLDHQQISKHMFDEEYDAQRVIIVSGEVPDVKVDVDAKSIVDAIQKGLEGFKAGPSSQQIERIIEHIEIPVIVKETVIERVEIPVIIKEIEYREIKVPFETVRTVEVEKPIFIKEQSIQIVKEETKETKYLRVAVGCLIILEIITLLLSRH